jgi:hypothetical protein
MGKGTGWPVRQDIKVLPADEPRERLGFTIKEAIGISAYNSSALKKVQIDGCPDGCLEVFEDEWIEKA